MSLSFNFFFNQENKISQKLLSTRPSLNHLGRNRVTGFPTDESLMGQREERGVASLQLIQTVYDLSSRTGTGINFPSRTIPGILPEHSVSREEEEGDGSV